MSSICWTKIGTFGVLTSAAAFVHLKLTQKETPKNGLQGISRVSIVLGGTVVAASSLYLGMRSSTVAIKGAGLFGASILAGEAANMLQDKYMLKLDKNQAYAIEIATGLPTKENTKIGSVIRSLGMTLTTAWMANQLKWEFLYYILCVSVGVLPAGYEGVMILTETWDEVKVKLHIQAKNFLQQSEQELSEEWDNNQMGSSAPLEEVFGLLIRFTTKKVLSYLDWAEELCIQNGIPKSISGYVKRSLSSLISSEIQKFLEGQRRKLLGGGVEGEREGEGEGVGVGRVEVGKQDCLVMYRQACDGILVGLEGFLKIERKGEQKRLI